MSCPVCRRSDGCRCYVGERNASTIEVKVTGFAIVKEIIQVLIDVSKDERIPIEVRKELCDRVDDIDERVKTD